MSEKSIHRGLKPYFDMFSPIVTRQEGSTLFNTLSILCHFQYCVQTVNSFTVLRFSRHQSSVWSPLLSICNSLEVIMFTALCVSELGNKYINFSLALPSSKDCIRLGSTWNKTYKEGKKYCLKVWKQDTTRRLSSVETDWFVKLTVKLDTSHQWEFSAIWDDP